MLLYVPPKVMVAMEKTGPSAVDGAPSWCPSHKLDVKQCKIPKTTNHNHRFLDSFTHDLISPKNTDDFF